MAAQPAERGRYMRDISQPEHVCVERTRVPLPPYVFSVVVSVDHYKAQSRRYFTSHKVGLLSSHTTHYLTPEQ